MLKALTMDTERAWSSLGIRRGFAQAVHVRAGSVPELAKAGSYVCTAGVT